MKKILLIAIMAILTTGAFASVNKGKNTVIKSTKKTGKSKAIECHAYQIKVPHYADCHGVASWYTVDHVDTISVTCVNGVAHAEVYPWDQDPSLICKPK